jgi:hypothetical protein
MTSDCDLTVIGNTLIGRVAAGAEIKATGTVTGAVIQGNSMLRGIENVQTVDPVKRIGGGTDFYKSLAEALQQVPTGGEARILLNEDVVITSALAPPSSTIVIDGQGLYNITRGVGLPVMTIGASDVITFKDIALVGSLDVNGNGAELHLKNTQLDGMVDVIAGDTTTEVTMDRARVIGDATDGYALQISDADPTIKIFRSYLKGASATAAVHYNNVTNDNLKANSSGFFHGSLGTNDPFARTGVVTPDYAADHCRFNDQPAPAIYNNLINAGQQNNTYDPAADFDWV